LRCQLDTIIDITRLLDRRMKKRLPTGIDRVSLEYIRYFGESSTALVRFFDQWIELTQRESEWIFDALLSLDNLDKASVRRVVVKALLRSVGQRFLKPRYLFNTGHSGLDNTKYGQRLKQSQLKPIFFIHDLIPLTHPEFCRPGESIKHRARMDTMIEFGYGVIANSETTLTALTDYTKIRGDLMPPAIVAPLAPASLEVSVNKAFLNKPYFVILGTIEPRKNHWLLLQLWRQLVEQWGKDAPCLVIIGQRGWECENIEDLLDRCEVLKDFVYEYSVCSDAELANWLQHSRALLFPSFAEGYGMPLIEALSLSVPVIASDLPAFHEIAGDIPDYIDPLDGKGWASMIMEYTKKDSLSRKHQCQRMAVFEIPTWVSHFELVESFMERLRFNESC
jgi:glycosyltransferase involved in cell wall biosynthesis